MPSLGEVDRHLIGAQSPSGDVRRCSSTTDEMLGLIEAAGFRVESSAEGVATRRRLMVLARAT